MANNSKIVIASLKVLGITHNDAVNIRTVAMTLRRWFEMECGTDNGGVERDEVTGKTYWYNSHTGTRTRCPDRETSAMKRLKATMDKYPDLTYYVQGDPRGPSLFILRKSDLIEGADLASYYSSRGVAVYK